MQPCVRAHATLCAGACHPMLVERRSAFFLTYLLTSLPFPSLPLPYLTTYSRPHAARWQVLLERYSAFLLATLSIEVDRLEQRRMARATSPRMPTAPHGHSRPAPPRLSTGASLRLTPQPTSPPPPPHAHSRLVPPTPRVPQTGGPDLSLTSAWWVELCCCPGASRPPWLPLSTQAPDQLGVP